MKQYGNEERPEMGKLDTSTYNVQAVHRACSILRWFLQQGKNPQSLNDVVSSTGLSRTTAFRLLSTLVEEQMLERPEKNQYRLMTDHWRRKRYRFGYASQSEEFSFSRLVSDSIRSHAFTAGVELLEVSNRYSPTVAIRNAKAFVRERVDLVIEFQTIQQSASKVSGLLTEAGIPIIAIEVPHPGADFYGANNYKAGVLAGHALARAAEREWNGQIDEIVLLDLSVAGPLPRSRLTGTLAGIRELLPKISDRRVRFLNGNGRFENSLQITRRYLQHNRGKRVLLGAANDPSCLGGLQAFEEAGVGSSCLAVGQNASIEARREMRRPGTRLVGSTAYFPEQYGEAVISLALDKLQGKEIPPATFVKHQLVTPSNVDIVYPNDNFLAMDEGDSLLYSSR